MSMPTIINTNEIKSVIENVPTNKNSGQDGFTDEFHQTFKEELTLILLILVIYDKNSQQIGSRGNIPQHYKCSMSKSQLTLYSMVHHVLIFLNIMNKRNDVHFHHFYTT